MILPTVFEVIRVKNKGVLSIMAKPLSRYLEDEIIGLKKLGVNKVVSLLEPTEIKDVGLSDEERYCTSNGLEYLLFPIQDRGTPIIKNGIEVATQLLNNLLQGQNIIIHCRAGIGRTGIIACAILILLGYNVSNSIDMVSEARGVKIPDTEEQFAWLQRFYSEINGKNKLK